MSSAVSVNAEPARLALSQVDIDFAAEGLEGRTPAAILHWAASHFGPRLTFATAFGAEGCVLVDLIGREGLRIDIFTLDTGLLFPETYALWRQLEERYGLSIRAVRPELTVAEQGRLHGERLWESDPDSCCQMRKVAPLRRALAGFDAWITSIRRDQTRDRVRARVVEADTRLGLVKVNPLAGWTADQVWTHLRAYEVPHNPLHERGYPSVGCLPCTSPVAPGEDPRAGRWRGWEKKECGLHAGTAARRSWKLTLNTGKGD